MARGKLQLLREQPVRARCEEHADKGKQVGGGLDFALVFPRRPVLQQRGDGHDEKSAEKSEQCEQHKHMGHG